MHSLSRLKAAVVDVFQKFPRNPTSKHASLNFHLIYDVYKQRITIRYTIMTFRNKACASRVMRFFSRFCRSSHSLLVDPRYLS
jgi:hypothetical protein